MIDILRRSKVAVNRLTSPGPGESKAKTHMHRLQPAENHVTSTGAKPNRYRSVGAGEVPNSNVGKRERNYTGENGVRTEQSRSTENDA